MTNIDVDPEALANMRARGGTWAAYQNVAFDSAAFGQLQFLRVGVGCTYVVPPPAYPTDTLMGLGWRYRFIGYVDLATGVVQRDAPRET